MTYAQMKEYFNILQDKFGSPYHTDEEITLLLNRAQLDQVVALLPVDGGPINVELNANTRARVAPLLFRISTTMQPVSGVITRSSVDAILNFTPVLRTLSVAVNDYPAKAVKFNNWHVYLNNVFKEPSEKEPVVLESASGWTIHPVDSTADVVISGLRYPVTMLSDGSVNCELPDFVHNDVVSRALELASVGSRDQMLAELKKVNNV